MDNALGTLNHVKQAFGADESYLTTYFDVVKNGVELQVVVRDGGVPAEPARYFVTVLRGTKEIADVGPEAALPDALRSAYSRAKSHIQSS